MDIIYAEIHTLQANSFCGVKSNIELSYSQGVILIRTIISQLIFISHIMRSNVHHVKHWLIAVDNRYISIRNSLPAKDIFCNQLEGEVSWNQAGINRLNKFGESFC